MNLYFFILICTPKPITWLSTCNDGSRVRIVDPWTRVTSLPLQWILGIKIEALRPRSLDHISSARHLALAKSFSPYIYFSLILSHSHSLSLFVYLSALPVSLFANDFQIADQSATREVQCAQYDPIDAHIRGIHWSITARVPYKCLFSISSYQNNMFHLFYTA